MRTNIIIDDSLMNEALQLSDLKTKKAVVEEDFTFYFLLKEAGCKSKKSRHPYKIT